MTPSLLASACNQTTPADRRPGPGRSGVGLHGRIHVAGVYALSPTAEGSGRPG